MIIQEYVEHDFFVYIKRINDWEIFSMVTNNVCLWS